MIKKKLQRLWLTIVTWLIVAYEFGDAWVQKRAETSDTWAAVAQADTILTGIIVVIIGIVGVAVVVSVNGTFDAPANTGLSESQQSLLQGFGSMLDLVEPLLVVLMAVIIILAVMRIRR